MRDHPLTPMTDANLVRVLQAQSRGKVGLLRYDVLAQGRRGRARTLQALAADGVRWRWPTPSPTTTCVCWARRWPMRRWSPPARAWRWACRPPMRARLAAARRAGGGAARGGRHGGGAVGVVLGGHQRPGAALAGSGRPACASTRARWPPGAGGRAGAGLRAPAPGGGAGAGLRHRRAGRGEGRAGRTGRRPCRPAGRALPGDHGAGLVDAGVRRLVVAGGETSGAVVQALDVHALRIGAPIDPGVPWTQALGRAGPAAAGAEVRQLRQRRLLRQGAGAGA
jgi:hypothetical protein